MINPEEIMLGNWVEYRPEFEDSKRPSGPMQWTDMTWYWMGESVLDADEFYPIPLTTEILKAVGFVDEGIGWVSSTQIPPIFEDRLKNLNVRPLMLVGHHDADGFFLKTYYGFTPIVYLHQLQNLYSLLIGESLNYNPTT